MLRSCLIVIFLMVSSFVEGAAPTAQQILQKADEVRNPTESYRLIATIDNHDGSSSSFEVLVKDGRKTFIRTLKPARDKGRNLLMIGEEMWAYVPNLKRAVRVALQQKLSGETANGDISRMRWSGDYEPTLVKEEGGAYVLLLTAVRKGLTYEKIRLWINQSDFHPLRAEYLSVSGEVLKRASFENYKTLAGALRPSLLVIEDAHIKEKKSRITIEELKTTMFADSQFTEGALGE